MARSPSFPTIVPPTADVDGLHSTAMGLKEAVETLQGLRGASPAPRVYTQAAPPVVERDGDFWLSVGLATTLNVSYAGRWFVVGTLS